LPQLLAVVAPFFVSACASAVGNVYLEFCLSFALYLASSFASAWLEFCFSFFLCVCLGFCLFFPGLTMSSTDQVMDYKR